MGIAGRIAQDQIGQGGFAGAVTELSNQLTEALTNNEELFLSIGEGLGNAVRFTADSVKFLVDNFAILKALGIAVVVFKATTAFRGLTLSITAATAATVRFNKFFRRNIIGLLTAAGVAAAEFFGLFDKIFDFGGDDQFMAANTMMQGLERVKKSLGELSDTSKVEFQTIQDEGLRFVRGLQYELKQLNKVIDLQEDLLGEITDENEIKKQEQNIEDLKTKYVEIKEAIDAYFQAVMDVPLFDMGFIEAHKVFTEQKFLFEELAEKSIKKYGDALKNLADIQVFDQILSDTEKAQQAFEKQVVLFKNAAERRIISEEDANTRIEKARRELEDKMIKITQAAQSQISRIEQDALGDRTRQIEIEFANRKRILERALEDELITKQRFAQLEQALEKKKLEELRKNNEDVQREILIQEEMAKGKTRDEAENLADFEKKSAMEKGAFVIGEGKKTFEALGRFNKQAFQAYKAFAIAEAIVSTYQGAAKALASFPPPFNFIAAAAVVAAGLANVNTIRSQSYSGRREGGPVNVGRSFIIGEEGPEIFTPNMNGQITPNSALGGNVNITFEVGAIDSQDLQARLADNRDVIVSIVNEAVNQQGRRSII